MRIKFISPILLAVVLLASCVSGSDSNGDSSASSVTPRSQTTTPSSNNTPTTTPITPTVSPSTPSDPTGQAAWYRIPMHYNILLGQSHVWNEQIGTVNLKLSDYASAGSSTLKLSSTAGLVAQQLITYRGIDGLYYSGQIQSINGNNLQLSTNLQQDVYAGENAWNFYDDGSHPNWAGAYAIADFSVGFLGWDLLNNGKHVLLGDSWFSRQSLFQRLKERLPNANVINQGVGGNIASQLLSRFDANVTWQNPTHVWLMTGTNDYWNNVSESTYKSQMNELISKVRAIGAIPLVFDSSVGPLNFGSDGLTTLSRAYVRSMDQLVAGN